MKEMKEKQTYSDGDDVENQILDFFSKERDQKEQEDFVKNNPSWPIKYHLSPDRHNLLSWYKFKEDSSVLEIGAGCGALTGLFLDKGLDVTAVELSKRRANIIKNRFKDRENLKILDGNIYSKEFKTKYNYVTSVGVLEYSGKYIDSDTPFLDFLKTAKGFLKKDGVLIVAIENQFGLKYWRGAPEDHTNVLFDSLEGYPNYDGIRTFGKKELTNLLIDTGLKEDNISFYYPLPDYKFCYEVFSDSYLPSDEHPLSHSIYPSPHPTENYHLFDEKLVAQGLQENDLFGEFANSFLVFVKNE
jgi:SAM-dependent methyltransferase